MGLLGPNGSGKTTIMKSITGLSQPTEGTITVFGAPVTDREKALMRGGGALIGQPALYENLTAQDHLRMAARYYPGVDQARMDKVLEIVGLTPYRKAVRKIFPGHEAADGPGPGAAVRAGADDFGRAHQRPGH